ncbi:MAG: hypothetical protein OES25_08680 [Acidobacteriota bacterium]|nr:hypothetical protein [Acidobacteriota bacterium]
MDTRALRLLGSVAVSFLLVGVAAAQVGEIPNLPADRPTHDDVADDLLSLDELRSAGLTMFTTPFNTLDGYGDGPLNLNDTVSPGGRPTLQGNGTFLRINGLDAQTCFECHTIVRGSEIPAELGLGGAGGSNSNAIIMPTSIDPADLDDFDGTAGFNGRFANPPFLFGVGGLELVASEMTADLQALKAQAVSQPNIPVDLITKGVSFGRITWDGNKFDEEEIEGVNADLVIRPFGRKGENFSIRDFDIGAMQFHFGMQPSEAVGDGVDADGDGVFDEITRGDLSVLSVFLAALERPVVEAQGQEGKNGAKHFDEIGCVDCHIPTLHTRSRNLSLRFPEVPTDPSANVFYEIDLTRKPARFDRSRLGGIEVPLFADMKRHDLGPDMAESFHGADEQTRSEFTTARLWGVRDSAPYLHDGRATTLTEAIMAHGGEAADQRDAFVALSDRQTEELLEFLRTLRAPTSPAVDLLH